MSTIDGALITTNSIAGDRLKTSAGITRSQMQQNSNAPLPILPFHWRTWDTMLVLPAAAAADDLGSVPGTFGTNVITLQAGDVKATSSTRYAITQIALPENYEDGQTVTLRIRGGMETTVSDTSCVVDAVVYEVGTDGTPSSDICATAAQSINSLTEADKDFTITPTDLVAGDVLEIRIAVTWVDSSTVTTVTPVIYKVTLLYDARG